MIEPFRAEHLDGGSVEFEHCLVCLQSQHAPGVVATVIQPKPVDLYCLLDLIRPRPLACRTKVLSKTHLASRPRHGLVRILDIVGVCWSAR